MNKSRLILAFFLTLVTFSFSFAQSSTYEPDQIILTFEEGTSQERIDEIVDSYNGEIIDAYSDEVVLVQINSYVGLLSSNGTPAFSVVDIIQNEEDDAELINRGLNYHVHTTPMNLGQFLSYMNMDEYSPVSEDCLDDNDYPAGYLVSDCPIRSSSINKAIKVAIIDTGLDDSPAYNFIHQYVADRVNVLEQTHTSAPFSTDVTDQNGHGTAVAGIIAGLSQRAGLTRSELELYIIKAFDGSGQTTLYNALTAVNYANTQQAHILNISWSYTPIPEDQNSQALETALEYYKENVSGSFITVAGAGNNNTSLNTNNIFPAAFDNVSRMITVGGVDCAGNKSSFSNYGNNVDIYALAENIASPHLNGQWRLNNEGTSFAAPIVTAALVQIALEAYPNGFDDDNRNSPSTTSYTNQLNQLIHLITSSALPWGNAPDRSPINIIDFNAACQLTSSVNSNNGGGKQLNANNDSFNSSEIFSRVYPNPFMNKIHLSVNNNSDLITDTPITAELWTLSGSKILIQNFKLSKSGFELNIENETHKGMYILKVIQNKKVIHSDIIVKQ